MTWAIKEEVVQTDNGNFYIFIEQQKFDPLYYVGIAKEHKPGFCGYPISKLSYPTLGQAKRRFSYLKKKALKGEF